MDTVTECNKISQAEAIVRRALKLTLRRANAEFSTKASTIDLVRQARAGQITQSNVPGDRVHELMVDVLQCADSVGLKGMARVEAIYEYGGGQGLVKSCTVKFFFWTQVGEYIREDKDDRDKGGGA